MVHKVMMGKTERRSFSRISEILSMPDLIEVQKDSYRQFVDHGFGEVLEDISPIKDFTEKLVLEFTDYKIDKEHPKYDIAECKERDVNYSAPLRVGVRLINTETGEVKQQEVYMGDFPLMTDQGTFIINGAERVIVSQLVRSPGAYYTESIDKLGRHLFSSQVIPNRGAWLEYETDSSELLYVKIDRQRKIFVTTFLRALGYGSDEEILELMGEEERLVETLRKDTGTQSVADGLIEIYKRLRPGEPPTEESARTLLSSLFFDKRYDLARVGRYKYNKKLALSARITDKFAAENVVDPNTGEILAEEGKLIDEETAAAIENSGILGVYVYTNDRFEKKIRVLGNQFVDPNLYLRFKDDYKENDRLLRSIGVNEHVYYPMLKNILAERANMESDEDFLNYVRENALELSPRHILPADMIASVSYLIGLPYGIGRTDDIDHLGNRRIRSVGELLQNQIRVGLTRLERVVRERMSLQDMEVVMPSNLINTRPVIAAIKEFFGSSQLSQFMDQVNPLAELTHKRRLSALGPGGLNRDRATFEVRDVHYSHYGRMCPIETPEGPNIGLINSLATYARINEYGFIEAPYRRIDHKNHRILDDIVYLTANEEDGKIVAQANEPTVTDGKGNTWFKKERIVARQLDQIIEVKAEEIDYMDVSPKQLVSVATAMIPFLENDDANRALMGSNMQRQAVPLLITEAPVVGTGMEYKAAYDSGVLVLAEEDCTVVSVSADRVVTEADDTHELRTYKLIKFKRSNQGTCINQRPVVNKGDRLKKGDQIADGVSTANGEIALGKNILIGFMTWEGYNYEDAVLISEKLVKEDTYTSIHIEEHETEARDTKLGPEEITRDIPNVGEDALKDLDDEGIVRIGAEVRSGDILVGKVTPKGETELTAEERLLRAIFGEKAREVRDTSLRVPHGEDGIVVDVRVFTRENKDELSPGVHKLVRVYIAQKRKISVGDKMAGRHGNKGVISRILPEEDMPFLPDGTPLQIVLNPLGVPSRMNIGQILELHLGKAAKALGWNIATPVLDGATEEDIKALLALSNKDNARAQELLNEFGGDAEKLMRAAAEDEALMERLRDISKYEDGKTVLYDGRSGEPFENRISVGYMYYLKLFHLVDDKIHARSTGPYSLVTQQPLGGKAQFGGQRFGEMEVWALEAYGAANTLQEILTVKSDDVVGRVKTYEAIVKGDNVPEPGVPESFKVLIKELQSLGLDIKVLAENKEEIKISEVYEDDDDVRPLDVRIDGREEEARKEEDSFGMFAGDEDEDEDDEDFGDDFDDEFGDEFDDEDKDDESEDDENDEFGDENEDLEPTDEDLMNEDEDL
ncbi:MAG: DNA-directed RNA polymerase subunit beta [Clostridia bacterium]|nr:DNA-directed RNA polymerase subunit beta [Clostridia bacterium]